jgi:DNA-binding FadR family transcriptional regulator
MRKLESEKIAEALRGELKAGRWKAGERLPSVAELRERFGVGEWAVRHALQNLRDDGFITIRQNAGAVATEKPLLLPRGRIAFVAVGAHQRAVNRVSDLPRSQLSCSRRRRSLPHPHSLTLAYPAVASPLAVLPPA